MLKINNSDVKSDMLSVSSNVREVLRALYFSGPDYIMLKLGVRERLVHKEQLVSLLELGKAGATVEDIMSVSLNEPISARMHFEDIPQDTFLLVFSQKGNGKAGNLSRMTFQEYREHAINESDMSLPDWWGAPLPLLFIDEEQVLLNDQGITLMPCDASVLEKQAKRMVREKMVTIKDKKQERTFSLRSLDENIYLIEDISGDFEMAEDLVWWAAVGKAFYRRLEENGAILRRLSPFEKSPENFAEVIPCSWEGEFVGSVAIGVPGEVGIDEPSERAEDSTHEQDEPQSGSSAEDTQEVGAEAAQEIAEPAPEENQPAPKPARRNRASRKPASKTKAKPEAASENKQRKAAPAKAKKSAGVEKRGMKPKSETETIDKSAPETTETSGVDAEENLRLLEIEESFEAPSNLVRLNKQAARKAYGGAARRAAPEDGRKIKG